MFRLDTLEWETPAGCVVYYPFLWGYWRVPVESFAALTFPG